MGAKEPGRQWYRPSSWTTEQALVVIFLCAVLPYVNTLVNGFVYDDNRQVLANPYLQSFRYLREVFTTTVWSYVGVQGVTNYYRPMMTLGYLLCYQFFGPLPYGFHLVSILLHGGVVLLLFWVTVRMFHSRTLALAAALVFAFHPIHTESVAWIAAVTDVELTLFYLLTFGLYLILAKEVGGRSTWVQLGMVGSFVCALFAKEQALTLPLLATIYEHGYRADRNETTWRQKSGRYGSLWLLGLAYVLFRIRFLGALAPSVQMPQLNWYQTALSAVALVGHYLYKLIWPVQLCAFYVFQKSESLLDGRVLLGLAGLLLLAGLLAVLWRRARMASFAVIWIVVTLAPVLNARWMAANVFAERYLYLPSVAFSWLAAAGIMVIWQAASRAGKPWRWAVTVSLALVAALAVARIVTRNRDWRDDIVLYGRTLAFSPDAYHIRNNLGTVYWARGNVQAAEQQWHAALKTNPRNAIILNNLGLVRRRQERYAEAAEYFRRAILLKPKYTDPHLNLGTTYARMGEQERAELQLRAAVALSPLNVDARNELGSLYWEAGRIAEAEEQFQRSLASWVNGIALKRLGEIRAQRGNLRGAEEAFQRAVALDRFDSEAHLRLAGVYARGGRPKDALREYHACLETDPRNAEAQAAVKELEKQL